MLVILVLRNLKKEDIELSSQPELKSGDTVSDKNKNSYKIIS